VLAPEKEDLFGEVLFGLKMFRKCVCVYGEREKERERGVI
jgi:hypothetical protein